MPTQTKVADERHPAIMDNELNELRKRIRPLKVSDGELHYAKESDPRKTSFGWADPAEKAENIEPFAVIRTYHSFGAPVFFKPSEAEVLAQIPKKHIADTVAYLTVAPNHAMHAFSEDNEYHVARTVLFRKSGGRKARSDDEFIKDVMTRLKRGEWDGAYEELAMPPADASKLNKKFADKARKFLAEKKLVNEDTNFDKFDLVFVLGDLIRGAERGARLDTAEKLVELLLDVVVIKGNAEHSTLDLPDIEWAFGELAEAHEKKGNYERAEVLRKKMKVLKETNDVWDEVAFSLAKRD
jgi:hypothetical protein